MPDLVSATMETSRLVLRPRQVDEADVYRRLWAERDSRVPAHRRIDAAGRPTSEDIAARLRTEREESGLGLLAVVRKDSGDVIGYCGLTLSGNGSPEEPELAFELLSEVHGLGFATEAGEAVVAWRARQATKGFGQGSAPGTLPPAESWPSSASARAVRSRSTPPTVTAC